MVLLFKFSESIGVILAVKSNSGQSSEETTKKQKQNCAQYHLLSVEKNTFSVWRKTTYWSHTCIQLNKISDKCRDKEVVQSEIDTSSVVKVTVYETF